MADPPSSGNGTSSPNSEASTAVSSTPVDELHIMNPNSHATSAESTAAEAIEDQLLQMASSPRGAAFASGDVGTSLVQQQQLDPLTMQLQLSSQKGESVSAMSALSAVDYSGHYRPPTSAAAVDHGPPTNIIQQQPADDADSMKGDEGSERMSEVSDFQMTTSVNENGNNLLNFDSSSGTSMGSQGSYADQVPALSNSTSASNGSHQQQHPSEKKPAPPTNREVDLARGSVVLPRRSGEGLMMMNPPSVSVNSAGTPMPEDVGSGPQNSDLDEILGPKGEPVQSDLDDILGPHDGMPSDLDDTLGPYQAESSKGPEPEPVPSTDSGIGGGLLTNYASKYTKQLPDTTSKLLASQQRRIMSTSMVDPNGYEEPSPTPTPAGSEPGTPTNHTPSMTRQAIDHIGRALAQRDAANNPISPTVGSGASILPEPSVFGGGSTAFGTALDYHTPRVHASPQSSTSSKNYGRQELFSRKAESVDSVEPASTWESRNNYVTSVSQATSTQAGETLSPDNQSSLWASSRGDTLSPGASSRGDAFSPAGSEAMSRSSREGHALSPSTRATNALSSALSSQDASFESTHRGTFSPHDDSTRGDSMTSPAASSRTDYSSQDDAPSPTDHTRDYSLTGHTRTGDSSQAESYVSRGDQFSPSASEYSQESARQFTFESEEGSSFPMKRRATPNLSHTASGETGFTRTEQSRISASGTGILSMDASVDVADDTRGGVMWEKAQAESKAESDKQRGPQAQKFAESIMARTRSRADPDALVDNASNIGRDVMETPTRSMVKLTTDEDVGIIESTALARKRVRVVQLLGAGLTTFLVAFMGGFWIQSSCHFVSTNVEVGENGEEFSLHFGLWKYTPIDSVFQGYSYCSQYDDDFVNVGPWVSRLTSNLALIGGAFSLVVLWIYLVFGRCNHHLWKAAVLTAGLSGVLQLLTLSIFAGPVCTDGCRLGPGGYVSVLAGCFYLFLAHEMYYNAPLTTVVDGLLTTAPSGEQPQNLMADLDMRDFKHGAKAYVRRLTLGEANPYPSLNQVQRDNGSPMGESMMERDLSKNCSYLPPPVFV
jgi:hypothetical protein